MSLFQHSVLTKYLKKVQLKAQTLKSEIEKTDRYMDWIIYELNGLTEEKIEILEFNYQSRY